MNLPVLHALLQNAALLLAAAFVIDVATSRQRLEGKRPWQVLAGVLLGALGAGVILAAFRLESGIVFDTRSVLLAIAGLFLGPVPTVIAMAITAAVRFHQGGAAAWTGVAVILASGGIGIAWRHHRRGPLADITWRELYALGAAVHVVMLALMLTLPWDAARRVLTVIGLPVLVIYPVATVALGLLLANRLRRDRTAAALAESEARYRSLFENNHATMLVIDPADGAIVDANPAACRFYGWTRAELQRMRISQINSLPPAELEAELARARATQKYHFLFQHRGADGTVRDVEVFSGSVTVAGRSLLYSIVHDITERREAEAALRDNLTLLRIAGDIARVGGWSVDLKENRVAWSDVVAAIHEMPAGYSPSVEEGIRFYAPEWREKIKEVFGACARDGTPYDEEMEIMTARGRRVWVRTVGVAIRDSGGKIVRIQGAFQDITESKRVAEETRRTLAELQVAHRVMLSVIEDQKRVETDREGLLAQAEKSRRSLLNVLEDQEHTAAALRQSEERYRELFTGMGSGVTVYEAADEGEDFAIREFNPAAERFTHTRRDEAIGRKVTAVFPTVKSFGLLEVFQRVWKTGRPERHPTTLYADGRLSFWVDNYVYRLPSGEIVAIFDDVTARQQAEAALAESNEILSHFIERSPIYAFIKAVTPTESRVLKASENYQEMIGIPGSQMTGKSMADLFPAEFAAKITADDWAVASSGKLLRLDEDLNDRHYTTIKFPIRLGSRVLLAGYTVDITERTRAQDQLQARAAELQARNEALERWHRAAVGRERRMIELKREVDELCLRLGDPARYDLEANGPGATGNKADRRPPPPPAGPTGGRKGE